MIEASFRVPAKILLFGEYGLLTGGKGLVLTTDCHVFDVAFKLQKNGHHTKTSVFVDSSFFPSGKATGVLNDLENCSDEILFFLKALQPWQQTLQGFDLFIEVKKSFSPRFGFGSSSALLSSLHLFLSEAFSLAFDSSEGWMRLRKSLLAVQGRGSGYDVLVQTIATARYVTGSHLWSVCWPINGWPVCENVSFADDLKNWGVIIDSGVYSDTKKSLAKKISADFGRRQTKIANQVLAGTLELKIAMEQSAQLAKQNGLHDEPQPFSDLLRYLENQNLLFKTLGAGHGDAVWLLSSRNQLFAPHPLTKKTLAQSILFDFSKMTAGDNV